MAQQSTEAATTSTAGQQLRILWDDLAEHFASLDATAIAVNFGLTLLVFAVLGGATWLFRHYVHRGAEHAAHDTVAKQVYIQRLISLGLYIVRGALLLVAAYLVARVWGLDLLAWTSSGSGSALLRSLLRLALLVAAAVAGNELARFLVSHVIERVGRQSRDPRRTLQLNTLKPLLRGIVQIIVLVIAALMILGEIGVQIGPLIAGAGIIGIAVGFGAQTVVKDFLTGVFLIVEDVVSVGDIIRIGDSGGLVEKMTLRTLQLRDYDGTLHVFPYSEAQIVHNMTKSFSFYVFNIQVAYETDVDRAMEVMREVGAELQSDPAFKDRILEPLDIAGVDGFADSGVKIKARFKTQPILQWGVGREYNRRLKAAFEKAGITIPYPHVHVVGALQRPEAQPEKNAAEQ